MEREIGRMLGPDDGQRKSVDAEARVVRRSSNDFRVSLTVATDETRSTRSFKAITCREASEAAALIVALAIDSRAKAPESPAPEPPPRPPLPAPAVPAVLATPVRPMPTEPPAKGREPSSYSLGVWASGRVAFGMQPGVGPGLEAGLFATRGAWRLEALFAFSPATRAALEENPDKGGDVSSFGVAGRGCHLFALGTRFALGPCFSAGVVRATGTAFGTERATTGSATWGALAVEAMARVALGSRFAWRGSLGPAFALDRPTFVIESGSQKVPVFRPDTAGFSAQMGLEARFF